MGWPATSWAPNATVRLASGIKFSVETDPAVPAAYRQPAWWTQGETPHLIQDVWIEANTGYGVHAEEGSDGITLDSVQVIAHSAAPGSAGFRIASNGNSLTGCSAEGHSISGFAIAGNRNRLEGCRSLRNASAGYSISGDENGLAACVTRGPAGNGIRVSGQRTVISGCVGGGFTQSGSGLSIEGGAQHLSVGAINASLNTYGVSATAPDHAFVAGIVADNGTPLHQDATWFPTELLAI